MKVTNVVAAHDIGRAINPPLLRGQIFGGVTQGIGMALMEDVATEEGRITSLNFDTYRIPRMTDIPDMTGIIVENRDDHSLTGAKGIGEPAIELIAPAIAIAVYNATGIRTKSLPIRIRPEELR